MYMKVILLQDVAKIGRRSQVVEVPDGYALNQLIPKRMAEPASAANMRRVERQAASTEASLAADESRFTAATEALQTATVTVTVDANDQGHTFKAVSAADIAEAATAAGVAIEDKMVDIKTPIKEVGEHTVNLVLGTQSSEFTVTVVQK